MKTNKLYMKLLLAMVGTISCAAYGMKTPENPKLKAILDNKYVKTICKFNAWAHSLYGQGSAGGHGPSEALCMLGKLRPAGTEGEALAILSNKTGKRLERWLEKHREKTTTVRALHQLVTLFAYDPEKFLATIKGPMETRPPKCRLFSMPGFIVARVFDEELPPSILERYRSLIITGHRSSLSVDIATLSKELRKRKTSLAMPRSDSAPDLPSLAISTKVTDQE